MSKSVLINLGSGSLSEGFPSIVAQLFDGRGSLMLQENGSLPRAPELADAYRNWTVLYQALAQRLRNRGNIEIVAGSPTNISEVNLENLRNNLESQFEDWLSTKSFLSLERKLNLKLHDNDSIQVIIVTENELVRQLPWHLWHFCAEHLQAEIALSTPKFLMTPRSQTPLGTVRILAVFGSSTGINLTPDRRLLDGLPKSADLVPLEKPSRQKLEKYLWDKKGWDILFFAGHSETDGEKGRIFINETESLTIDELKHALTNAIAQGLQLAIFNSCEGLGLARQLEDLHIPQVIVMKESVPDRVAHEFLQHFLQQFASGESFYLSVRRAREQLQEIEKNFPCASWLPVICQNPATIPPNWQQLCYEGRDRLLMPLIASVLVTSLVIGLRSLGILQGWELMAYDQLMRARLDEETDPRLLVVTANKEEEKKYDLFPQPDRTLAQVIEKLNRYQPRAIGLDILLENREKIQVPGYEKLIGLFDRHPHLIGVCTIDEPPQTGIAPPWGMPKKSLSFIDLPVDPDDVIRRISLFYRPAREDPCQADHYLAARLALTYLEKEGLAIANLPDNSVKTGKAILKPLPAYTGAYQHKGYWGFEVMLNYRHDKKPFRSLSFTQVLQGNFDSDWVKDKVILIGMDLPDEDRHVTPYSVIPNQKMPGVTILAHGVSQIISASLDGRPLVWVWNVGEEALWIGFWSVVGGALAWRDRRFLPWILKMGAAVGSLYGICWGLLTFTGGWVPLVPSLLALAGTSGTIFIYPIFAGLNNPLLFWRKSHV